MSLLYGNVPDHALEFLFPINVNPMGDDFPFWHTRNEQLSDTANLYMCQMGTICSTDYRIGASKAENLFLSLFALLTVTIVTK